MSLLLLFRTRVRPRLTVTTVRYLRRDDMKLIEFIQDELVKSKFEHVEVIDAYPRNKNLQIPTIAVEHVLTKENVVEVGNSLKEMDREYSIDILAHSKAERDELKTFLAELLDRYMTTDDGRINTIYKILHSGDIERFGWLVTRHKIYYYIEFDGVTGYAYMPHDSAYITNALTLDFDLNVLEAPGEGEEVFLFDKYIEADDRGYKLYLSKAVGSSVTRLNYEIGVGLNNFGIDIDFTEYIGQRIQLSCTMEFTGSSMIATVWIDGNAMTSTVTPWFLSVNTGDKNIHIGAQRNAVSGLLQSLAKMRLYGMRITNDFETSFGKTGEYLIPNSDNDLTYLSCNEGKFNTAYDKSKSTIRNLSIFDVYSWVNYLRDETPRSEFQQSVNIIRTKGLRRVSVT